MDRPIEAYDEGVLRIMAEPFRVDEDLFPMSKNAKLHVSVLHEYLQKCFPRHDEGALYEVALTIWRLGKGF